MELPGFGESLMSGFKPFVGAVCAAVVVASAPLSLADRAANLSAARQVRDYGKLPLNFELNTGQAPVVVEYLARGDGYGLFLTPTQAVLALRQANRNERRRCVGVAGPGTGRAQERPHDPRPYAAHRCQRHAHSAWRV
jgi:hypothetical protein